MKPDYALPSSSIDFGINPGLTKREYFAAMAMQGYIACSSSSWSLAECVEAADGLIAELNKTPQP
jgi:hypothetical protein